jgi:hypothetical protein
VGKIRGAYTVVRKSDGEAIIDNITVDLDEDWIQLAQNLDL